MNIIFWFLIGAVVGIATYKANRHKQKEVAQRIERDTACDRCEHLSHCKENGCVLDCTALNDTRTHYLKNICAVCLKENKDN